MQRTASKAPDQPLPLVVHRQTDLLPLKVLEVKRTWPTLRSVVDGAPCHYLTCFRFFHTEETLYLDVVANCRRLTTRFTDHNDPLHEDDVIELFLRAPSAGTHELQQPNSTPGIRYLELQASPAGRLLDAWVSNRTDLEALNTDRNLELAYNTIGPSRPTVEALLDDHSPDQFSSADFAQGVNVRVWKVRFRIPLAGLELTQNRASNWTANVFRIQRSASGVEHQAWKPTGRIDFHRPECFGRLQIEA